MLKMWKTLLINGTAQIVLNILLGISRFPLISGRIFSDKLLYEKLMIKNDT